VILLMTSNDKTRVSAGLPDRPKNRVGRSVDSRATEKRVA